MSPCCTTCAGQYGAYPGGFQKAYTDFGFRTVGYHDGDGSMWTWMPKELRLKPHDESHFTSDEVQGGMVLCR